MRHRNNEMWLDRSGKSGLFLKDSSFVVVAGVAGKGWYLIILYPLIMFCHALVEKRTSPNITF